MSQTALTTAAVAMSVGRAKDQPPHFYNLRLLLTNDALLGALSTRPQS